MIRIGQGFDAHRLVKGKPLIIGGVNISYEYGLEGHSDADVLIHAVIDALLGALSCGNIGTWFPDNDSNYKNIDSLILLKHVIESKTFKGWKLVNLDSTLIAQKPKFSPFLNLMQNKIADIFNVPAENISIKAKTTEGMGFCGRSEGITALANLLIEKTL